MFFLIFISLFSVVLVLMFFFFFGKMNLFDFLFNSSFECGFTSYYFSRFSFSMHYFLVGMIFLFLDLELCILMPFVNENYSNLLVTSFFLVFVMTLLLGLLKEWSKGLLDWKF